MLLQEDACSLLSQAIMVSRSSLNFCMGRHEKEGHLDFAPRQASLASIPGLEDQGTCRRYRYRAAYTV
jgi:hypothetical protein